MCFLVLLLLLLDSVSTFALTTILDSTFMIASLRAYGAQEAFAAESMRRINVYTSAARTSYNLNRWVCIRIDALGALFASGLAVCLVYFQSRGAANTGFSLNMAGKNTLFAVPSQAHLALKSVSVERSFGGFER